MSLPTNSSICPHCSGKFRLRMDLVDHISRIHGKSPDISNDQGSSKRFKQDQIEILDIENDTVSRQFKCQECCKTFTKLKDLTNHRYKTHITECNECDYKSPYAIEITRHYSHVHAHEMSGQYGCSRCDYRTSDVEKLKKHQTNHQMVIRSYPTKVRLYLDRHKLPFAIQTETPSDGDCFYHALLDQLKLKPSMWEIASQKPEIQNHFKSNVPGLDKMDQSLIKSLVMNHIRLGGTDNVVCEDCPNHCSNGSEHLEYLSTPRIWADEFVIQGATSLLDITLCLILPNWKTEKYSWSNDPITNLYMFYFPKLHFQSLAPLVAEEECLSRLKALEKSMKDVEIQPVEGGAGKSDDIEIIDDSKPSSKSSGREIEVSVQLLKCYKCNFSFANGRLLQNHNQLSHTKSISTEPTSFEDKMKLIMQANAKRAQMFQQSHREESRSLGDIDKQLLTLSSMLFKQHDVSKNSIDLNNENPIQKEIALNKSPLRNIRMNRKDEISGKESKDINDNEISEIHPLLIEGNDLNNNDIDSIEVTSSGDSKIRTITKDQIKKVIIDRKMKYSCVFCDEIFSSENLVKYHIPSCDKSTQSKKVPKINPGKVTPIKKANQVPITKKKVPKMQSILQILHLNTSNYRWNRIKKRLSSKTMSCTRKNEWPS